MGLFRVLGGEGHETLHFASLRVSGGLPAVDGLPAEGMGCLSRLQREAPARPIFEIEPFRSDQGDCLLFPLEWKLLEFG